MSDDTIIPVTATPVPEGVAVDPVQTNAADAQAIEVQAKTPVDAPLDTPAPLVLPVHPEELHTFIHGSPTFSSLHAHEQEMLHKILAWFRTL